MIALCRLNKLWCQSTAFGDLEQKLALPFDRDTDKPFNSSNPQLSIENINSNTKYRQSLKGPNKHINKQTIPLTKAVNGLPDTWENQFVVTLNTINGQGPGSPAF